MKEQGDVAAAAKVFEEIPDYADAAEQHNACLYVLAMQALENGETQIAADYLLQLGEYQWGYRARYRLPSKTRLH